MYKPNICNGTIIRDLVIKGGPWWECVPEVIRGDLERVFVERLRRLAGVKVEVG
jgi:hypothetical protein